MEESFTLKLIIEKGPREGETLEYSSRTVVKIGRVVRGNTIGIKDPGISSKHISIQFDNDSTKWNLTDLDSSNGTIVNGETLSPNIPSVVNDGDCIKIGEFTSIIVKIGGVHSTTVPQRNTRRQGKAAVVEKEQNVLGLGLGFDGDLGENGVQKRKLRPRARKAVDSKNEVENLNINKRSLRSSKKEENVSSISTLNQIPEDANAVVKETADQIVPVERKVTRGRTKKLQVVQLPDSDIVKPADIVVAPADGKKTRRGLPIEPLEELQTGESVQVHVTVEPTSTQEYKDQDAGDPTLNGVENSVLDAKNESVQDYVAEGLVKEASVDTSRWQDLEKMTLGDFFDYLEWYLPKEIRERTEEIISQLPEKTRKFHEVIIRLQRNGEDKGKQSYGLKKIILKRIKLVW